MRVRAEAERHSCTAGPPRGWLVSEVDSDRSEKSRELDAKGIWGAFPCRFTTRMTPIAWAPDGDRLASRGYRSLGTMLGRTPCRAASEDVSYIGLEQV